MRLKPYPLQIFTTLGKMIKISTKLTPHMKYIDELNKVHTKVGDKGLTLVPTDLITEDSKKDGRHRN